MPSTPPLSLDDLLSERRWLVGLSRHLIASSNDAEDVAQETLMLAIVHSDRVPEHGRRGWLAATARNVARTTKRANFRRTSRERIASKPEATEELDTDELVALAEFQARAANAVVALPDAERTIIVLRFFEGLTSTQIAARLGITAEAARQRISRAVRSLRAALDERDRSRAWGAAAGLVAKQSHHGAQKAAGGWSTTLPALAAVALAVVGLAWWWNSQSPIGTGPSSVSRSSASPSSASRSSANPSGASLASVPLKERPTHPAAPESLSSARPVRDAKAQGTVRLVDPVTKLPVAGVEWFVLRTGNHDEGRLERGGTESPNPEPIKFGITKEDGLLSFSPDGEELLHLATLRKGGYAASSWPVEDMSVVEETLELELSLGKSVSGRVVNDIGNPVAGAFIIGRNFFDRHVELGVCDSDGAFLLAHIAPFPRAYAIGDHGQMAPGRVDGHLIWAVPPDAWTETRRDPWAGQYAWIRPSTLASDSPTLPDIEVKRTFKITGHVRNQDEMPLARALVSTVSERVARAADKTASKLKPLPWSPDGALAFGEALTGSDGSFELEARGDITDLAVITRSGVGAHRQLALTKPGGVLSGMDVTVTGVHSPVQLKLTDPTQPDGALRNFAVPGSIHALPNFDSASILAQLIPDMYPTAVTFSASRTFLGLSSSGVGWLNDETLDKVQGSATLVVDGYFPARINFAARKSPITVELKPMQRMSVTLLPPNEPAQGAASSSYDIVAVSPAWIAQGREVTFASFSPLGDTESGPHAQGRLGVELGDTLDLAQVPGKRVWFHVRRGDDMSIETFGPFDPKGGPIAFEPEAKREKVAQRVPKRAAHLRMAVFDADSGAPVEGAILEGGFIHAIVGGRSNRDGELVGWAMPDVLSLGVYKEGMRFHRLAFIADGELQAGDVRDFGKFYMKQLRRIPSRLIRQDGSRLNSVWQVSYRDGAGLPRIAHTSRDGSFALKLEGAPPATVRVGPEGSEKGFFISTTLQLSPDGTAATCAVPTCQPVRVEVAGLDATWRLAPGFLVARRSDGMEAQIIRAGTAGKNAVFLGDLPLGEWTLYSGPLFNLTEKPKPFRTTTDGETLRISAAATIKDAQ